MDFRNYSQDTFRVTEAKMNDAINATGTNGTNDHSSTLQVPDQLSLKAQIALTSAYAVTFLIALFGNFFGLLVVLKKSSRNATNLFIANMAIADLLLTVTVMPYQVKFLYKGNLWFGGKLGIVTCKVLFYAIPISIAASVLTMMLISFERFYAVFFPLREAIFQRPKILSTMIWILSFALMFPYVFLSDVSFDPDTNGYHCHFDLPTNNLSEDEIFRVLRIFHISLFVMVYALPLFITIIAYTLICRTLARRKIPGNITDSNRAVVEKSRRKVVRLLVVICVVFALCWFPTYVTHFFWFVLPDQQDKLPYVASFVFLWIAHANSAINPCLYVLLNDGFRKALFGLFKDLCGRGTNVVATTSAPDFRRGFTRKAWNEKHLEHVPEAPELIRQGTQPTSVAS
ncbi:kappa-type opioid receptor-like isoform X2 [Montipora capricornis]|uniref:kappa-type opioid receptor-like isoform X2 n=1 Tax=Montipora capricornis TaxID=246305 RepID=UPI0035F16B2A